jgi:hypothetical protein
LFTAKFTHQLTSRGSNVQNWPIALIAWIFGCLLALLFAFIHPGAGWEAFDRLIQVLTALGTISAVVAALRVAGAQSRDNRRQALDRANLVASGIAMPLNAAYEALRHHALQAEFSRIDEVGQAIPLSSGDCLKWKTKLRQLIDDEAFSPSNDTLLALVSLPQHCATRLNAACTEVKRIRDHIDQNTLAMSFNNLVAAKMEVDRLVPMVNWCVEMLTVPVEVLNETYVVAAPYPRGEELHAD